MNYLSVRQTGCPKDYHATCSKSIIIRFLPVAQEPETSFRLTIQPSVKGDEFMNAQMRLDEEIEGAKFPDEVSNACTYMYLT